MSFTFVATATPHIKQLVSVLQVSFFYFLCSYVAHCYPLLTVEEILLAIFSLFSVDFYSFFRRDA